MHTSPAWFAAWIAAELLAALPAQATEYYVSPGGSDSAPGTQAQPFQTIQQAATVMVAGDTAYILAGVYRETVIPANSGTQSAPITFMPYNGESVTVSGADVIPANSWTLSSGNIYKAPMSLDLGAGANQVFLDGQMMIEAQWPNTTLDVSHPTVSLTTTGTYTPTATSLYNGTITDINLPSRPAGYWNGATINTCLGSCWWWQTGTVTDSSVPQQLTFSFLVQSSSLVPQANNSYFLTGLLGELDSPSEWFRDAATSNLFFWTPLGDNPSGHLVEVRDRPFAFDLSSRSFITIQGLGLFAAAINSDANSQYLVLDSLQCRYVSHVPIPPGQESVYTGYNVGIVLIGMNNILRNSTVAFSSGTGVYLQGTGQRILNNVIRDTDYRATYASPILAGVSPSDEALVAYNSIYNSGRYGIYHPSNFGAGRILHNEIYDYGLQTNDLGCNYTWMTNGMGTEIAYNLCHDSHGLLLNNSTPWSDGIYLDNGSSNFVVHHNVAWNTPFALNLNVPSTNEQVYSNTFVGSVSSFIPYGDDPLTDTTIENNIFVGPIEVSPIGAVMSNNILPGTDPQFVDPASNNYQLLPSSPAIAGGLVIPPYTNGYSAPAPDIGAYDHTKQPWKAGAQNAALVSAPSYAPTLTPGTIAVVTGSVPFDSGASVTFTDGANADWPAPLVYVFSSPPQLAFQVPAGVAPGVAVITITNGGGAVSLASAPLFAGTPPVNITATQGSGQSAPVNTLFPTPLQATVTYPGATPVPGAAVTFAAPSTGPGGGFELSATVFTNGAGVAVAPAFVANALGGAYTVTASAAGVATAAVFNLTNSGPSILGQTITFGFLTDQTLGLSPSPLTATASSGLEVSFVSNTSPVCTLSRVDITLVTEGICSITASQAGDSNYAAATSITQTFTVSATGIQPVAGFLDQNGAPALTFNNTTNIPDAGGFLIAAPGVTQDLYGNTYIVGLDSLGGVHLNSYNFANSTWNGWQYSGGILDTTSGLSAAVDPSGVVWFTGRDIGQRYWINSWNGTSFGGWTRVTTPNPDGPPLDGIFASTSVPQIAITGDGNVWIIGTDIGGRIWSNSYNPTNQTFTGWVDRQGVIYGQPSATAGQDGLVYVAVRNVASESPVYITQIPAGNAPTATTFLYGGGEINTDPVVTSQGGTVYALAEADGNTPYLLTFSEATQTFLNWTFTGGILNDSTIAAAAGNVFVAGRDGADRIYWYSVTGNSWFFAGGAGLSSTVLTGAKQ